MLRYLPSWDDYFEVFQSILRQIQSLFSDKWNSTLNFDTSIRDVQHFRQNLKEEKFEFSSKKTKMIDLDFSLTNSCEKCGENLYRCLEEKSSHRCQNEIGKRTNLSIEGRGFFGTTNRNSLVRFESIFSKEFDRKSI